MAILGFLTHTLADKAAAVEKAVSAMPELTTYGIHKNCYVVTVAEAPTEGLEAVLDRVRAVDGVLAVYVTSFTREDEEEDAPPASEQTMPSRADRKR